MKTARAVLLVLASVAPTFAAAPVWDSSGTSQLNGNYYFRNVLYAVDSSGNASGYYCYYGNIAFDGKGSYTISNATFNTLTNQGPSSTSAPASGTYSVSASGYGFMTSPLISGQNMYFMVSQGIVMGNHTESGTNDMFIAAPVGNISTFSGGYTVSAFFPGPNANSAADATYQLNPDGAGHLNTVSISGYVGTGTTLTQSASNVTYKFSNNAAVITYPTNNSANFYSGQEFAYFSPDSNFMFGGSPTGFDMFVGVKNASGSPAPLSGLYYETGLEESGGFGMDTFYGTFNASQGNVIGHERILFSGFAAEGLTYYSSYPVSGGSTYQDSSGTVQFTIGQNGFRITNQIKGYLGIGVAVPYTPPAPTGQVYLDPTGIVNTASSAPYTAGISPGEFLTFYNGVNLASATTVATSVPFPTTLGNVKVLIDGIASPIYYVSSTQISVIVPYDVSTYPIATIQVSNNGVLSNIVTAYVNKTTPGVFTSPVGGIGVAAMLDFPAAGGYYIVSNNQPAHPGDTVAAYLTGLGAPFPAFPAGSAPTDGDSLVQTINVTFGGVSVPSLAYAGLAPGLAGLYQINFTIPTTVTNGNNILDIQGPDSETLEAIVPIIGAASSVRPSLEAHSESAAPKRRLTPRLSQGR